MNNVIDLKACAIVDERLRLLNEMATFETVSDDAGTWSLETLLRGQKLFGRLLVVAETKELRNVCEVLLRHIELQLDDL